MGRRDEELFNGETKQKVEYTNLVFKKVPCRYISVGIISL